MNKIKAALVAATTVLVLAGCNSTTADSEPAPKAEVTATQAAPVVYNESDILEWIGAKDYIYTTPEGIECEIAVVMTTPEMVAMYANAGDVTAANADGSAGVKIVSPEAATCQTVLNERLEGFPDGEKPEAAPVVDESEELRTNVELYSNLFLNGQGAEAYNLFSNRCMERVDPNEYIAASEQAKQMYGPMEMKSFEAEVSGTMARVTYTYPVPALDQQQEPWVYEDGLWKQDDC